MHRMSTKELPTKKWYAVQTKPHSEFLAKNVLSSVPEVQAYLPTLQVEPVNPRAQKIRPFFPGYLFAYVDLDQVGPSAIQWSAGVTRLVGYGEKPIPIPDRVIAEIRRRVQEAQHEDPLGVGQFQQGDRVRITAGPLEGFEGMFDARLGGRTRSRILLEFVGRLTATEVDIRTLEKLRPDPGRSSQ
jgi:transcription elongation factor/antiterminator RfaH